MIDIQIDQALVEQMAREAIEEKLKSMDESIYFLNTKQVLKYVNMSWNSFQENILHDPAFKAGIRLGSKWLFNKAELDLYLDKFFTEAQANGGDIYKRKKEVV
ncbi:hypothetical protein PGH26_13705 [Sporosarcina jeotgali]|uniref:Helix-turn-helix domain-containing protein n=1 Tax=Sporosarcina jeotgali TaxID=3020056 RepID=A0ABZ0KTZ8_9BACL|nr:hypothetical protein [Sporosarcina sp. B2O-1]WOV83920.1 hypothetical protein PGH26_13705 [Sporosarcina sp. B2O-1]